MNETRKCSLPDQTRFSQVRLRTADVKRQLEFYTEVLGFKVLDAAGADHALSASGKGPGFLVLHEEPKAVPRPPRSVGLYHFAVRYPAREELARAYRRLRAHGYPIAGASDHGVSEAIYLSDPDSNGIELYADRPRSEWRWQNGQVAMVTTALDLDDLLASISAKKAAADPPTGAELGHIHLHVADLAAAERFYREYLGLALTQRSYPGALFFASGGYHHHVAVNVWAGKSVPPPNSVGLISYRFEVPVPEILYCLSHRAPLLGHEIRGDFEKDGLLQIRDPNGNWLEIEAVSGTHERSGRERKSLGFVGVGQK